MDNATTFACLCGAHLVVAYSTEPTSVAVEPSHFQCPRCDRAHPIRLRGNERLKVGTLRVRRS